MAFVIPLLSKLALRCREAIRIRGVAMPRKRSEKKRFTADEIRCLSTFNEVASVRENRISFTIDFRKELYGVWLQDPSPGAIRQVMMDHGIPVRMLGRIVFKDISKNFREHGCPVVETGGYKNSSAYFTTVEGNQRLLDSGLFIRSKNGRVAFSPDFMQQLWEAWPEQPIIDGIRKAGLDPDDVGYHRIYTLYRDFKARSSAAGNGDGNSSDHSGHPKGKLPAPRISQKLIDAFQDHPCIRYLSAARCTFEDAFLNEASLLFPEMTIDEIFTVFELDPALLTPTRRYKLQNTLGYWKTGDARLPVADSDLALRIEMNRAAAMEHVLEKGFTARKPMTARLSAGSRKAYCEWLKDYPTDASLGYSRRKLLKAAGISPSCYYAILKNEEYGNNALKREEQDAADADLIREVMAYKGFRKGTRQVYMQMKRITGKQFSIRKIRRLKRKFGISSGIREAHTSRKAMRELVERNRRPNELKRTFRLHRPGEVVLSDVTYLDYGELDHDGKRKRAYLSPAMDSVDGNLLSFAMSGSNDLMLALRTLEDVSNAGYGEGVLYHTDQGILYLQDSFQQRAAELGFVQSMSKRGNSQDNSPCEVLHGNFKQEVDYLSCKDEEELRVLLKEYETYYNNERPQWGRGRMTPAEYRKHLDSMTPAERDAYMAREQERYDAMKARAVEKAVERARTLGVTGVSDKGEA